MQLTDIDSILFIGYIAYKYQDSLSSYKLHSMARNIGCLVFTCSMCNGCHE